MINVVLAMKLRSLCENSILLNGLINLVGNNPQGFRILGGLLK